METLIVLVVGADVLHGQRRRVERLLDGDVLAVRGGVAAQVRPEHVPQPLVPVQMPGRDHHLRARGQVPAAELLWLCAFTHHHRYGRVQAQRLSKDGAGNLQPLQGGQVGAGCGT